MPDVQLNLPLGVHTLAQVEACRVALESLADTPSQSLEGFDPDTKSWLTGLSQQSGAESAMRALTEFAREATVFDIELARSPGDELVTAIVHWLRATLAPNILIRVHVQRSLIGGLRLRTGKHVYDLSLAQALRSHANRATELLRG